MSELLRDVRFGLRLLAKSPAFAMTATLLLALGIGANTLIFSVVNALLLRPLPVSHPENLVRLVETHPTGFVTWDLPYNVCAGAATHDADLAEAICQGQADIALQEGNFSERVRVHFVSPNFFPSLGVRAYLGRALTEEDERAGAANAVLSYGYWKKHFRGDASIAGRGITLGGRAFTVVGVTPEYFNGLAVDATADIRVPAATDRFLVKPESYMNPAARSLSGQSFGRLRDGVSLDRANAEVDRLLHASFQDESERVYPPAKEDRQLDSSLASHLRLESIANGVSTLRSQFTGALEALTAGVALLLLMACANIAGLLLARSEVRAQEMGIRRALGASRGRIVRQLLTEGMLLAALGGMASMPLTWVGIPLLLRFVPPTRDRAAVLQPMAIHIAIDGRVLAFSIAVTFLTAIVFALSPALRSAGEELAGVLRGNRTATRGSLPRKLTVGAQVAVCTLILMGSALLIETLARMRNMNPGFDREHLVTFTIDPSMRGYTAEQSRALSKALLDKTSRLPGVASVGISTRALMRGSGIKSTYAAAGTHIQAGDFLNSSLNQVTPGYFTTMGMRILAGRDFDWSSPDRKPPQAIVNETFARRFFPRTNPIGRLFGHAGPGGVALGEQEIAGVVSDAKYRSLREPVPPTVYLRMAQGFDSAFNLQVRMWERPENAIEPVRRALAELDPALPVVEVLTSREEVENSLWQERLLAWFSSAFGAIAALVAATGLYGALDFAVKSRTREIGIRMAVGARPTEIAGLVSRETIMVIGCGVVLGMAGYAAAAGWLTQVLYDVSPWQPTAALLVVALIGVVAAISAAPAALRAIRIDAATALRTE
jgi:predicted permease